MIFRAAVLGIAALAVLTLLSANARADAPAVAGNAAVVAAAGVWAYINGVDVEI